MAKQTNKPMPKRASLDMLDRPTPVNRNMGKKMDMVATGVWHGAGVNGVDGNFGKYEDGTSTSE